MTTPEFDSFAYLRRNLMDGEHTDPDDVLMMLDEIDSLNATIERVKVVHHKTILRWREDGQWIERVVCGGCLDNESRYLHDWPCKTAEALGLTTEEGETT